MKETMSLRLCVRRELALAAPTRGRRPSSVLFPATLALLLGLGSASSSPAMPPVVFRQELLPDVSILKVGSLSHPALADLDNDGDLDLLAGEGSGRILYLENTGSSSAPAFMEPIAAGNPFKGIAALGAATPDLADLDGDGDLDLILGQQNGTVSYYVNSGTTGAAAFVEATGSANPFAGIDLGTDSSPCLVDLDADGDLDAAIGHWGGTVTYFANTGNAGSPAFLLRTGSADPFSAIPAPNYRYRVQPELADLDADGDLDLLFGEFYGHLWHFRNTGSSSAPAFTVVTSELGGFDVGDSSDLALGDLDADGDPDLVIGEDKGRLLYFSNTGGSSTPAFVELSSGSPFGYFDLGNWNWIEGADLDGDGDRDLALSNFSGSLAWAENTGSSSMPAYVVRFGSNSPFGDIFNTSGLLPTLGDLDDDGDFDVIFGQGDGTIRTFFNIGNATSATFLESTGTDNLFFAFDVGFFATPELADFDADGDLDCLIGRGAGGLRYFENTGTPASPVFIHRSGSSNPFAFFTTHDPEPDAVDLDGDLDVDVAIVRKYGRDVEAIPYLRNTGPLSTPGFVQQTGAANPMSTVIGPGFYASMDLADFDGDGDLDAFFIDGARRLIFFRGIKVVDIFADGFESGNTSGWSATTANFDVFGATISTSGEVEPDQEP